MATYQDFCAYIEYLARHTAAPATIRNKISQLRIHFQLMDAPSAQLNHPRVYRALDALDRNKSYVPRLKNPIPPDHFYSIISSLHDDEIHNIVRAALLTLYYGVLRQSEILPRSVGMWDPVTQPTRQDLSLNIDSCSILIKKAKNLQKAGQSRVVVMQAASNPIICPVLALRTLIHQTPTISPNDPLFMFPLDRRPVPASFVLKQLHEAMERAGLDDLIPTTSLHSIRKSAATDAFMAGCSENSIKNYGGWSSQAYRVYIQTSNQHVNRTLIRSLNSTHPRN